MSVVIGDWTEITSNHPNHGSMVFSPKAGESSTLDLGGIRSADEAGAIDGRGRAVRKMNRVRWGFEVPITIDMNTEQEQEYLNKLAADPLPATFTFTHISGVIYGATGFPVGDLQLDANEGTLTLKLSGDGECERVA